MLAMILQIKSCISVLLYRSDLSTGCLKITSIALAGVAQLVTLYTKKLEGSVPGQAHFQAAGLIPRWVCVGGNQ